MELDEELKIITVVTDEIGKVPEERRQEVVNFILNRLNLKTRMSSMSSNTIESLKDTTDNNNSIQDFIKQKNPKNNYQLIACLGYYLEKYKGNKEFGTPEIREANSEARQPRMGNIPRDLKNTQYQYNYVTNGSEDSSKKMLTTFGEDLVKALPSEEDAKIISQNARKNLKKKKTSKKSIENPKEKTL